MSEEKKKKGKELKSVTKTKKKAEEKKEKKIESVDEKQLLKEAEKRDKEAKVEAKILKKVKKEEKKAEEKKEKAEEIKLARTKKRGKKYKESEKKIEKGKIYEIDEAIKIIKELPKRAFDPTIELHLRLDKKVENLRGVVNLPAGTPKTKTVLEIDEKNIEEVIKKIKVGKIKFDIIIATPKAMPRLAVLAKILGPKGLMPNPKNGTIAEDTKKAAEDFKSGKIEFRADKGNNIHFALAKVSYSPEKINENVEAALSSVPIGKVISAYLNATMGPSIKIKAER